MTTVEWSFKKQNEEKGGVGWADRFAWWASYTIPQEWPTLQNSVRILPNILFRSLQHIHAQFKGTIFLASFVQANLPLPTDWTRDQNTNLELMTPY